MVRDLSQRESGIEGVEARDVAHSAMQVPHPSADAATFSREAGEGIARVDVSVLASWLDASLAASGLISRRAYVSDAAFKHIHAELTAFFSKHSR